MKRQFIALYCLLLAVFKNLKVVDLQILNVTAGLIDRRHGYVDEIDFDGKLILRVL